MPGFAWMPEEEIQDIATFIKSVNNNSQ